MTDEVLGYDCQGQVLRAGDLVVPGSNATISPMVTSRQWTLSGEIDEDGLLVFVERSIIGAEIGAEARMLRRINSGRASSKRPRTAPCTRAAPTTPNTPRSGPSRRRCRGPKAIPRLTPALEAG